MKRLLILLCLAAGSLAGLAQNPGWTMPSRYVKYVAGSPTMATLPVPTTLFGTASTNSAGDPWDGYDAAQVAQFSSNMMRDRNGNIEFFIVDGMIYDGKGHFIDYLLTPYGDIATGFSETAIVPDPANCERYYIIAHRVLNYDRYPYVFLLDMSLPNYNAFGPNACAYFGQLVPVGTNGQNALSVQGITPNWSPNYLGLKNSLGMIAASDVRTDGSRLAFITNNQGIFRYKISDLGFQYDNALIPFLNYSYNHAQIRSEMELVRLTNGHYRIAVPYHTETTVMYGQAVRQILFVAELDANGDVISGTEKYFPIYYYNPGGIEQTAYIRGLEFSADGNRLYVSHPSNILNPAQLEYYDFSTNLPDLQSFNAPAAYNTQLSMLELGANDRLLIAHANGLYQIPNASTAPVGVIGNLTAFSYAANGTYSHTLYQLPDQIDGMDYTDFQTANLQCCINSSTFTTDYHVAATGTWQGGLGNNPFGVSGSTLYIKQELRVPQGVSLNITNMTLRFAPGARLVIERGAGGQQGGKLTLNGTVLSVDDRCSTDQLWLGVEVWGNGTATQGSMSNSTQGRLILQNNARIEHASIGVLVSKRITTVVTNGTCPPIQTISPFSFDQTYDGGIVQGSNSSFVGNQRGVWFRTYVASNASNNLSYFSRCDFTWNGNVRGGLLPLNHADLLAVKGVRFYGCNFRNTAPNLSNPATNGTGILSNYAQFNVAEYCGTPLAVCEDCPAPVPSTFTGLRFGVRTYNPDDFTFWVTKSTFTNCQYGIWAQLTKNATIIENQFNIRQATYQTAGISMYSTPTFRIQENHLDGQGSAVGMTSFGIVINNSGTANNDVYKNWFSNLKIAAQSEGANGVAITNANYPGSTVFNMSGLNYTCNDFGSGITVADMTVVGGRIDYFQGHAIGHSSIGEATLGSARNRFSLHGEVPTTQHDIRIAGSTVQELQYVGLNTSNFFPDAYTSNWVLPLTSSYNGTLATATANMCPSQLCPMEPESLLVTRAQINDELQAIRQSMQGLQPSDPVRIRLQEISRMQEARLEMVETRVISHLIMHEQNVNEIRLTLFELGQQSLWARLSLRWQQQGNPFEEPVLGDEDEFMPLTPPTSNKVAAHVAAAKLSFHVSPNPSQGHIELTFDGELTGDLDLTVVDLLGRTVHQGRIAAGPSAQLDLSHLTHGVYFVMIKSMDQLAGSQKIEIRR